MGFCFGWCGLVGPLCVGVAALVNGGWGVGGLLAGFGLPAALPGFVLIRGTSRGVRGWARRLEQWLSGGGAIDPGRGGGDGLGGVWASSPALRNRTLLGLLASALVCLAAVGLAHTAILAAWAGWAGLLVLAARYSPPWLGDARGG